LDWPALADHPFIADCDVLAPVVYLPGAVEYSQLPRSTRTPAAAAAVDTASKPLSVGSASSRPTRPQSTDNAQQQQQPRQQQQQQHLRAGSPADGKSNSIVDVLQFRGEGMDDLSLPLSEVVGFDDDNGGGGGGGGDDDDDDGDGDRTI
jgi:hypothetical protein